MQSFDGIHSNGTSDVIIVPRPVFNSTINLSLIGSLYWCGSSADNQPKDHPEHPAPYLRLMSDRLVKLHAPPW